MGHSEPSCFSALDSNALLSACRMYQHLCLPEHSSNVAQSEFEGYAKGRELGTLGQGPVRFVKVTHRLVNYKKTWTSIIKLGKQCMDKMRSSTKK